jgi:rhodanese-related sulfurtransferase
MTSSVKQLLAAANEAVPRITPDEARKLLAQEGALLVDVRDGTELARTGKLKGAVHVSRGMIEFRADPDAQSHNAEFRKDRPVILYCGSGGRSALAGKTLKDMGYERVHNLGGFKELSEGGFETEPA